MSALDRGIGLLWLRRCVIMTPDYAHLHVQTTL